MIKKNFFVIILCFNASYLMDAKAQEKRWQSEKEERRASKEAENLCKKAGRLWKEEQYAEAEKLYYQAHQLYPIQHPSLENSSLHELAKLKMELGDIRGAN